MNTYQKRTARYIYDPQLTDPRLDFYPRSAFDYNQEPWVAPLCLLARDLFGNRDFYWGSSFWGGF